MGIILSRFRRKKSTKEQLQSIEKEIKDIHEFRIHTEQRQKRFVGSLIAYSVVIYISASLLLYFYYFPSDFSQQILCILPLLLFPVLVWLLKEFIRWYFQSKLHKNESKLTDLLRTKRKILDEVMENETYLVARELLEKYDPDQLRKKSMADKEDVLEHLSEPGPPGPPMPRPILPRDRTFIDRLVEYLVGDGPTSRYALICRQCHSHNGMALKEEFEFIAFRCCYCFYWNPARKQRPAAPRLPEQQFSPAPSVESLDKQSKTDDAQNSISSGDSESGRSSDDENADVEDERESPKRSSPPKTPNEDIAPPTEPLVESPPKEELPNDAGDCKPTETPEQSIAEGEAKAEERTDEC